MLNRTSIIIFDEHAAKLVRDWCLSVVVAAKGLPGTSSYRAGLLLTVAYSEFFIFLFYTKI